MLSLEERLTDAELRLWRAIKGECRKNGGHARSLFHVGVDIAALEYRQAYTALGHLERVERVVDVQRDAPGAALIMQEAK